MSKGQDNEIMARRRAEGDAAFEPRSRRPLSSPSATPGPVVDLVLALRKQLTEAGLDPSADTIGWRLTHHHAITLSRATINRVLVRAGAVIPEPAKRPRSSYIRFEAQQPNETWQSGFTQYRLTNLDDTPGSDVEVITWLTTTHYRYALHVSAHHRVTARIVLDTFSEPQVSTPTPHPP